MSVALLALFAGIALLVLLAATTSRGPSRYRGGAAAGIGARLVADVPATAASVALLTRWRDRAARWRLAVAGPAVVLTIAVSVVVRSSLDIGIGAHPAWSDPLLMGLLGAFLGAMAAEFHLLRRRAPNRRSADLTPRDVADHLPSGSRIRLAVLAVLAAGASASTVLVTDGDLPVLGLLALVGSAAVPLVQRGIVARGRPALEPDLRAADDAVRELAVLSVDQAGAGAILLLSAWQLAPVYTAVDVAPVVEAGLVVAQVVSLVVAVVWWRRSNPRRLLPDIPAVLGSGIATPAQP
jgi:hypothetical protein